MFGIIAGIQANELRCNEFIELSLSMVTALAPRIGYDRAAEIVKEAHSSGRPLREVAREMGVEEEILDQALDHRKMARPND